MFLHVLVGFSPPDSWKAWLKPLLSGNVRPQAPALCIPCYMSRIYNGRMNKTNAKCQNITHFLSLKEKILR